MTNPSDNSLPEDDFFILDDSIESDALSVVASAPEEQASGVSSEEGDAEECLVGQDNIVHHLLSLIRARDTSTLSCVGSSDDHNQLTGDFASTLTLTWSNGTIQEYGLFASRQTSSSFVKWFYGFPAEMSLQDNSIADALSETMNQLVGRFKEAMIRIDGKEPMIGLPQFMSREAIVEYVGSPRELESRHISHAKWDGSLWLTWNRRVPRTQYFIEQALLHILRDNCDKVRLTQVMDSINEAREAADDLLNNFDHISPIIDECETILVEQINHEDDLAHPKQLALLREHLQAILTLSESPQSHFDTTSAKPRSGDLVSENTGPKSYAIDRDPENIDLLREFVDEADDLLEDIERQIDNVESQGNRREIVEVMFRALHSLKGNAAYFALEEMSSLAHASENLLAEIRDHQHLFGPIEQSALRQAISLLYQHLEDARQALDSTKDISSVPQSIVCAELLNRLAQNKPTENNLDQDPTPTGSNDSNHQPEGTSTQQVKIDVAKLDDIESNAHELKIIETELLSLEQRLRSEHGNEEINLRPLAERLSAIRHSIAGICTNIRMVPLEKLMRKMGRVCRELARENEKLVNVKLVGGEIQIPRRIATALGNPMIHLIRNAIDHGIETREERAKSNKPALATISFTASCDQENLTLAVVDDGRGIDSDAVLQKAISKGLVPENSKLSETEIFALISLPGFSTKVATTNLSGRGVGMDVVKHEIGEIGGHLQIESILHHGTTFRIIIPFVDRQTVRAKQRVEALVTHIEETVDSGDITFL